MSQITMSYNFPEDRRDFLATFYGPNTFAILSDVTEHVRGRLKYGVVSDEVARELEQVREMIQDGLDELPGEVTGY